jgi:hypothetical protein
MATIKCWIVFTCLVVYCTMLGLIFGLHPMCDTSAGIPVESKKCQDQDYDQEYGKCYLLYKQQCMDI